MSTAQQQRPQSKRHSTFSSFKSSRSVKSDKSNGSSRKLDLKETEKEKRQRKMSVSGKADPTRAITEEEPFAVNQLASVAHPLRNLVHKDQFGNVITDPDRSNPTRPRMERPLDTIRAFEAAVDMEYKRKSHGRLESEIGANGTNNRNSIYQGSNNSTYGARPMMSRPDSYVDPYGNPQSPPMPPGRGRFSQRMNSDPAGYGMGNGNQNQPPNNPYQYPPYQQSRGSLGSGLGGGSASGGSYNTEPWGNSTDPSSENSSLDRIKADSNEMVGGQGVYGQPAQPYTNNNYGQMPNHNGFGHVSNGNGMPNGNTFYGQHSSLQNVMSSGDEDQFGGSGPPLPALPPKDGVQGRRAPIKLNAPTNYTPVATKVANKEAGEKRKSWFRRSSSRK